MEKEEFFVLATKYLSKEASAHEIERLHTFLGQKKYSTLFKTVSDQWEKAGGTETVPAGTLERGLNLLNAKLRRYHPSFQWEKEAQPNKVFMYHPVFIRIAAAFAVLLILATGTIFLIDVLKQRSDVIAWNEKKTVMGEKSIVTLLDGTRITLDADSKLKYPARFGEESREVSLEGEAYFEVTHDDAKPFIVRSGGVTTTDLGTKFNINAFPDEENIIVSLEEGKVEVSTSGSRKMKEEIILTTAQQLTYNKDKGTNKIEQFDLQKAVGWKDNILVFDNEPLSKILLPLERYFGVKFELADQSLANRTVKANFRNESFWTVVKVIEKATGLSYKTNKENNELKKIVFYLDK
jgi:ferric-dicitrate binding protein FerR (iron transport regulator)